MPGTIPVASASSIISDNTPFLSQKCRGDKILNGHPASMPLAHDETCLHNFPLKIKMGGPLVQKAGGKY